MLCSFPGPSTFNGFGVEQIVTFLSQEGSFFCFEVSGSSFFLSFDVSQFLMALHAPHLLALQRATQVIYPEHAQLFEH